MPLASVRLRAHAATGGGGGGGLIIDTFNRPDSTTSLGTTSDGVATWVQLLGTWGITSNQAYCPVPSVRGYAYVESGVSDCTVQVTGIGSGGSSSPWFRGTDASNFWLMFSDGVYKCVAGSFTRVIVWAGGSGTFTHTIVLAGSSITLKVNGTTIGSATDSFNSTATKHGIKAGSSGDLFDNFSIA